jgi:hypothetical protein
LGKNDGKDASVCAAKRMARSLRGATLNKLPELQSNSEVSGVGGFYPPIE